jgi:hypothetical protein
MTFGLEPANGFSECDQNNVKCTSPWSSRSRCAPTALRHCRRIATQVRIERSSSDEVRWVENQAALLRERGIAVAVVFLHASARRPQP